MARTATICFPCRTRSKRPKITARKVREARDYLEVPIAVENVSSYAEFHMSEMTEWEFLNEVVERADCGILLDVNNIYVSSRNHDFDPYEYLNSVPAERVAQIHIAGHSKFQKYILDTHDHPVIDPVWKMYEHAIRRIGPTATLLEWDDRIPSFDEVHAEALKAEKYIQAPAAVAYDASRSTTANGAGGHAAAHGLRSNRSENGRRRYIKPNDRSEALTARTPGNLQPQLLVSRVWIRCMMIFRVCARCSGSGPSIGSRGPISPIALRGHSRCAIWVRVSKIGCSAIRSIAGSRHALALDMVRLEWAHIEAFDNAAEKVLGPEDLLELGPRLSRRVAALHPIACAAVSRGRLADSGESRVGRARSREQRRSKTKTSRPGAAGEPVET